MKKKSFSQWVAAGVLLITLFAVLCLLPLIYMVAVSFTDSETLYIKVSDLRPSFYNYWYAIVKRDFGTALKNSIITVVGSCLLVARGRRWCPIRNTCCTGGRRRPWGFRTWAGSAT